MKSRSAAGLPIVSGIAVVSLICMISSFSPAVADPAAPGAVGYVVHVSVDGLRSDVIGILGPEYLPNFHRMRIAGIYTDNARTDFDFTIHLRRGAGAYICGEESALLESLEGKRGLPRNRPPYPAQSGLFGRPTLINNVESLFWLRQIVEDGAQAYQDAGRPHFYSVSGRVRNPGVKLAPAGTTVRQLIDDYSGGMAEGHSLKAYLPGGASGGLLPASLDDLPLDFGTLEEYGCFVGSSAVVVISDQDDIADVAHNLVRFFEDESCGQCTPCRSGCEKLSHILASGTWNEELITDLSEVMREASICGLGQAAANPVMLALKYFREDVL